MNSKINKWALTKYSAEQYPKLFSQVGESGLLQIQEHDEIAAKVVSELSDCDEVIYVGYSKDKSSPPETITSFVDCNNRPLAKV